MQNSPYMPFTGPQVKDRSTQTVRYDCTICDSRFSSKAYLHHHEVCHATMFYCPFTCALFSNKPDFQKHVKSHTEKKLLPCSQCNKTFIDVYKYVSHVKEHTEKPMITCNFCSAKFLHISELRKHMSSHYKKKFIHVYTKNSETENAPVLPRKCHQKPHAPLDNDVEIIPNGSSDNHKNREGSSSDGKGRKNFPTKVNSDCSDHPSTSQSNTNFISTEECDVTNIETIASGSEVTASKRGKKRSLQHFGTKKYKSLKSINNSKVKFISRNARMQLRSEIVLPDSSEDVQFLTTSRNAENVKNKSSLIKRRFSARLNAARNRMQQSQIKTQKKETANNITPKFLCTVCKLLTLSYARLLKHELIHTRKTGSYVCDGCQARFKFLCSLKLHTRSCKVVRGKSDV